MEAAVKDLITRRMINPEEAEGFLNATAA